MPTKRLISYVLPIYNEAENIGKLFETLTGVLVGQTVHDFEFIFVNDGSRDDSLQKLYDLQAKDRRVTVINLARNFGHQVAVTAGLDYAKGDAVIIMDSDLQDPPAVSVELIGKWQEGWHVVYAQRRTRQDGWFKKVSARLFYWLLNKLADINIPHSTGDFRLIDRRVVDALKKFHEHNRFLRGLVSYVGFKQVSVLFDRDKRYAGSTGYPLKKMLKFAFDGIFGFSLAPLKLISRIGYTMAVLSFLAGIYAIVVRLFAPETAVPGWAFTVIAISFTSGIQLILLGVLGSYIGRIYTEAQNRPLYIVESVKSGEEQAN
jgi:dolichol-phosphate mannosyltransferase